MARIDGQELDDLLRESLKASEAPDEKLIRGLLDATPQRKGVSLWWLPMAASLIIGAFISILALLFAPYGLLKAITFFLSASASFACIVLTVIGAKCFELKEMGRINL